MGRITKPLSDAEVKRAKPLDKEHVLYDCTTVFKMIVI